MVGCCGKMNVNDLCAYTSPRIVRIRDWRLGSIYYSLILAIFCYVVIYSVVVEQRYRVKAFDIVGSTRLQLKIPSAPYAAYPVNTSYCAGGTIPFKPTDFVYATQYPCRFYDQYDSVDPGLEPAAMFVSTRITESNYTLSDNCALQPNPACQYQQNGNSTTYYIGNVDMFTLLIDHTFSSQLLGISKSAMSMTGQLIDQNGNKVNACDDYAQFKPAPCDPYVRIGLGDGKHADIMPLKTLLRAAGINSLEEQAGSLNETHRQAGTVLVVSIIYSNYYQDTGSWRESYFTYTYTVAAVNDAEFKYEEVIPNAGSGLLQRRILDRHGVRILIKQAGNVGQFDVLTLIISLTSSLGLLAVASVVVDILATRVMPLRHIYSQYKKVDSVDFEGVKLTAEELRRFQQEDLVNPKPKFLKKFSFIEEADTDGDMASSAALLASAAPSQLMPRHIMNYGLNSTPAPYGYAPMTAVPQRNMSFTGEADRAALLEAERRGSHTATAADRRGSGISLKSQQVRPLPPGPPPPHSLSREGSASHLVASGSSGAPTPTGPHHGHTGSRGLPPARAPFASIASGDGSESEAEFA